METKKGRPTHVLRKWREGMEAQIKVTCSASGRHYFIPVHLGKVAGRWMWLDDNDLIVRALGREGSYNCGLYIGGVRYTVDIPERKEEEGGVARSSLERYEDWRRINDGAKALREKAKSHEEFMKEYYGI